MVQVRHCQAGRPAAVNRVFPPFDIVLQNPASESDTSLQAECHPSSFADKAGPQLANETHASENL
jgi:hypothetical protein